MNADAFVVGGGVSGLAAAVRLAQAGRRVVVFEARGVCGGRATSFDDREGHEPVDNGQHALMGCYHEAFRFLDAIGSRHLIAIQPALSVTVIEADGRRSTLSCPSWPSPFQVIAGVARWTAVPFVERAQLLRVVPALVRARQAVASGNGELPVRTGETVRAWLQRHGQGARLVSLLWEPLAVAALNQAIDVASARPFVRVLGQLFGPGRQDASIALAARPLREVFAEPAVRYLETRGSTVSCDVLARIEVQGTRAVRITRREAPSIDLDGRPVIVATPWHALPTTVTGDSSALAPLLRDAAATLSASIVSVNLWFERPLLDVPMLGLVGQTFQWVFAREGYVALVMSGAEAILRESNDAIVALALRDLRRAVPAARALAPLRSITLREPRATFSLGIGQPARPPTCTEVSNLWLAGDWVDTGLPATIEGAVAAGNRAAEAVVGAHTVPAPITPSRLPSRPV